MKIARENCDAMLGLVSAKEIVNLTKIGSLDMSQPSTGIMGFLKRLRGNKNKVTGGEKDMAMLRQIPRILRFIPGKAQDLRAYFLSMQYWLAGSDINMEQLVHYLMERYGSLENIGKVEIKPPLEYPETGLYHPSIRNKICEKIVSADKRQHSCTIKTRETLKI